jgi:hypothetical protein
MPMIDGGGGGSADATVTGEGREDPADACNVASSSGVTTSLAFGLPGRGARRMEAAVASLAGLPLATSLAAPTIR